MGEQVLLNIFVDEEYAPDLIKEGFAEVAFRQKDAKFKKFMDFKVTDGTISEAVASKIEKMLENQRNINADMSNFKKLIDTKLDVTKLLNDSTKNMANQMNGILKHVKFGNAFSIINTGLSIADIGVSVAGFLIVSEKLNNLNREIQQLSASVDRVLDMQKYEKMADCQKLIMRCNSMIAKVHDNEIDDLNALDDMLIELRGFITEMKMNFCSGTFSKDVILRMIYTLIPTYTILLNEYTKRHYFSKNNFPVNFDSFLDLYNDLIDKQFNNQLMRYYFMEEKLYMEESRNLVNAHVLLGVNGYTQIEDQITMLKTLKTERNYYSFNQKIDEYVEQQFQEVMQSIA